MKWYSLDKWNIIGMIRMEKQNIIIIILLIIIIGLVAFFGGMYFATNEDSNTLVKNNDINDTVNVTSNKTTTNDNQQSSSNSASKKEYGDWEKSYKTGKYDSNGNPIYRTVISSSGGGQYDAGIYEEYSSVDGPISRKRIG